MKSKVMPGYKTHPLWDDEFATGEVAPESLPLSKEDEAHTGRFTLSGAEAAFAFMASSDDWMPLARKWRLMMRTDSLIRCRKCHLIDLRSGR